MSEHEISTLLALITHSEEKNIRPSLKPGVGVVYEIGGVELQADKLKTLSEKGYLEQAGFLSFPTCPTCGDTQLTIEVRCPKCKSNMLEKGDMVIHYECNYIAPVEEFAKEIGKYVCPRCGKTLKRVGIDYGRPGIGFKCANCGEVFQFPLYLVTCSNGHTSKLDEIDMKYFPIYRKGTQLENLGYLLEIIETISESLTIRGFKVKKLSQITGVSSAKHIVPIFIESPQPLIVEFLTHESNLHYQLMQILVKSMDLNAVVILVSRPELEATLKSILNPERVRLVTASTNEEIIIKVIEEVLTLSAAAKP